MSEFEAMLLSAAIEGPLAFAVVSIKRWPCRGPFQAALTVMLATAATHPQLWTASQWLFPRIGYWSALGILEGVVILVEAAIIVWVSGLSSTQALVVSGVTNSASATAGIILFT
jgi:hypothetical protein